MLTGGDRSGGQNTNSTAFNWNTCVLATNQIGIRYPWHGIYEATSTQLQYSSCHTVSRHTPTPKQRQDGRTKMNDMTAENVHIVTRIMFNFIALPNDCLCFALLIYMAVLCRCSRRNAIRALRARNTIHKHDATMQKESQNESGSERCAWRVSGRR